MGKANISFPDGMLEDVDRRASAIGTTRSAFIQVATAHYIAELDHDVELTERASRIERAIAGMREVGAKLPAGPDGVTLVRQMRDATPEWLTPHGGDEDE